MLVRSLGLLIKDTVQRRYQAAMSSLTIKTAVDVFEKLAPLSLAESWDNVGLLVEPTRLKNIRKILVTNDLTEPVMQEAISSSVNLIYSYHPPIFAPLKRVTASNWKVLQIEIFKVITDHSLEIFLGTNCRPIL